MSEGKNIITEELKAVLKDVTTSTFQAQPSGEFHLSPDAPRFYTNAVRLSRSPFDVTLDFGYMAQEQRGAGAVVVTVGQGSLMMSQDFARVLYEALGGALRDAGKL